MGDSRLLAGPARRASGVAKASILAVAMLCALGVEATVEASFDVTGVAHAGPDAGKLRNAADAFEEGARAFKDARFEEAAAHFESADANVPSAKALRWAMRARSEAKQASRAATLAALALDRHKDDAETAKLATETLDRFALGLHKLKVECVSPCLLAESGRIVHGEAATRRTLYLEPGSVTLGATFVGNIPAPEKTIEATPGGTGDVRFEPKKDGAPLPPTAGQTDPPVKVPPTPGPVEPPRSGKVERFGANPALFVFALTSTVTTGGMLAWSAVDSTSLPSIEEVRRACRGKTEETCPALQTGNYVETRTNVLLGVTIGLAAFTIVSAIVTDWGGDAEPTPASDEKVARAPSFSVRPALLWVDSAGGKAPAWNGRADRPSAGTTIPSSNAPASGAELLGGTAVFGAAGVF